MLGIVSKKRVSGTALKRRKLEVQQRLATFGLRRAPRRLGGRVGIVESQATPSGRLGQALESLGPVFAAFGRYLSSRVDLLPMQVCQELANIADQAAPTPITTVRDLLFREIGATQIEAYTTFEDEPFESGLLFQSHRAVVRTGQAVTVKVVHPELQEYLECDLDILPVLKPALAMTMQSSLPLESAIADFRHTLMQHLDLRSTAKAFEDMARDTREFEILKTPMVYRDLCTSQVLTSEYLPGITLKEHLASGTGDGSEANTNGWAAADAIALARRLCMMWLHQVLLGTQFPVAYHLKDIVLLPTKQIAYTGGEFARLPPDAKKNLWNYLIATANEEPDKACTCLLQEMIKGKHIVDEEELQHRFREIVPFRNGSWQDQENSNSLAEHLFAQWQLASKRGLEPHHHLIGFYRGLFQTTIVSRQCTRYDDPLLEGLQDVRTVAMLSQFNEMMELAHVSNSIDKYAAIMMTLPKQLDDMLTLAAAGSAGLQHRQTRRAGRHVQHTSSTVVVALLLVLAAVVLLSHYFAATLNGGVWVDTISAAIFVLVGALLLRAASQI